MADHVGRHAEDARDVLHLEAARVDELRVLGVHGQLMHFRTADHEGRKVGFLYATVAICPGGADHVLLVFGDGAGHFDGEVGPRAILEEGGAVFVGSQCNASGVAQ